MVKEGNNQITESLKQRLSVIIYSAPFLPPPFNSSL